MPRETRFVPASFWVLSTVALGLPVVAGWSWWRAQLEPYRLQEEAVRFIVKLGGKVKSEQGGRSARIDRARVTTPPVPRTPSARPRPFRRCQGLPAFWLTPTGLSRASCR